MTDGLEGRWDDWMIDDVGCITVRRDVHPLLRWPLMLYAMS